MADGNNINNVFISQENSANKCNSSSESTAGTFLSNGNTSNENSASEKFEKSDVPSKTIEEILVDVSEGDCFTSDLTSPRSCDNPFDAMFREGVEGNITNLNEKQATAASDEPKDDRDNFDVSPAHVRKDENGNGGELCNGEFPIDVTVRDCKSESDVLDAGLCDNGSEVTEERDGVPRLASSLKAAANSPPERVRHRKNARSRSWCARSAEDALSVTDVRLLRERLLRTQSHPQPTAIRSFSRTQRMTLVSLALVDFMSFCSMSIMAPFFPREASEKGMSDSVSGFVFSFYALVMFVTSPFFGKILPTIGAKFLFMSGIFLAGSCNLLFGCLEYIQDYNTFTTFCLVIRGLEAVGASAYSTAGFVFVVNSFPNHIGSVLGILETFIGLGMSVGPAIGGLLYSVGGFGLPFYVLGVAMVATLPINYFLLSNQEEYPVSHQTGSLLELAKVPAVVITSLVIVAVSNTWAFLDPTLEPHLRQFNLSTEQVGLIFLLFSGLYGLFSPIWGYLADRINRHWCMMVWGLLLCTAGLLLLGPSPLLPFLESSLWLNLVGLSIIGISVALTLLPTFQGVLSSSIEEGGCGDNLATYSIVAGVWSCMYSLGEVIGPSLGGVLLKNFGFPICSTVMAAFTFVLSIITLAFFSLKEANKLSSASDSLSDSTSPPSSWGAGVTTGVDAQEDQPLLSSGGSATSGGNKRVRQSYGGTGISAKNVKDLNQNQQNVDCDNASDHFKLEYLFQSKPNKNQPINEIDGTETIEGLRALIQSDFYQKYLDSSLVKMDSGEDVIHKENPFVFDANITESDGVKMKKDDSGIVPRICDVAAVMTDQAPGITDSTGLLQYNKDKVKYYSQSRQDDCEDLILDRDQVTDVRGTINITSSGACEV